jgi:acetyl-CoA decarbonylase/synthase complex subunit gamma
VDTEGIGIESAVAGRQFSAVKIKEAIDEFDLESKVSHRVMMLPGLASRISGETEEETGWKVIVGPKDSGSLKAMNLKELWEKKAQEE